MDFCTKIWDIIPLIIVLKCLNVNLTYRNARIEVPNRPIPGKLPEKSP